MYWQTFVRKAGRAVRHHALALCGANSLTQIGFGMQAIVTFPAFRRVERDHCLLYTSDAADD